METRIREFFIFFVQQFLIENLINKEKMLMKQIMKND